MCISSLFSQSSEQQLSSNSRRSFSFSSLRIKSKTVDHTVHIHGDVKCLNLIKDNPCISMSLLYIYNSLFEFSTERHSSHEAGGFTQRRGLRPFSSVREASRKGNQIYTFIIPSQSKVITTITCILIQ